MDDKKIRGILIEYLCERYEGARIYEERGIGDSICDLMLVTNCLIGFEIKSDQDNLHRLARQVVSYSAYFDKNYIVVGEKYAQTILGIVPSEWGVLVVGETSIELQREARTGRKVNVRKQLSLLWSIELKNLLIQNNLPLYAQKTPAYAEAKALAMNSPLLKEFAEKENEVKKYSVLCIRERESKERLKAEIADLDKKIVELQETIERDTKNQEFVKNILSISYNRLLTGINVRNIR